MTYLLIFFALVLVLRQVLPWLLRWLVGRLFKAATGAAMPGTAGGSTGRSTSPPRPDGRVRVDYVPPRPKRQPRPEGYRGGEYVEFEEVR
jgi:hypothetical protein